MRRAIGRLRISTSEWVAKTSMRIYVFFYLIFFPEPPGWGRGADVTRRDTNVTEGCACVGQKKN